MSLPEQPSIGLIGAGKVGATLARLLSARGCAMRMVFSRTPGHARALADAVGASVADRPADVVAACDLTLLTVPDDALASLVGDLAPAVNADRAVVHTSGARSVDVLAPLAARGAMVGSLHPAFPFADVEAAVRRLPGATFAIEAGTDALRRWLIALVAALDGRVLIVPPGKKALYHAALVFASNYTVTLYALAESLLVGIGAERAAADGALDTLLAGTVENLRAQGIPAALTGPLVRADTGTIAAHLRALGQVDGRLVEVYTELARLSLSMLAARGVETAAIEDLLQQGHDDAFEHP